MEIEQQIKVVFILPTLKFGGAERIISFVSQKLNQNKFDVTLIVVGHEKDKCFKVDNVKTIFLNKSRVLLGVYGLYKTIKKINPQIVVSSIGHLAVVSAIFSLIFRKTKFASRETNMKAISKSYTSKNYTIANYLHKKSLKFLDLLICQSKDMAQEIGKYVKGGSGKIVIINNPITSEFNNILLERENNNIPQYITVGRLSKIKGQDRIIRLLSKLPFKFHYTIIGSGPEKDNILKLAKDLNMESSISFVTHTNNVPAFLSNSDAFLQGSYAEGFPNASLESCAVGTPVIAFNALGGTREIIKNGVNGFIVENDTEYIEKLKILKSNPLPPDEIKNYVFRKFSEDVIINNYEKVLISLIK